MEINHLSASTLGTGPPILGPDLPPALETLQPHCPVPSPSLLPLLPSPLKPFLLHLFTETLLCVRHSALILEHSRKQDRGGVCFPPHPTPHTHTKNLHPGKNSSAPATSSFYAGRTLALRQVGDAMASRRERTSRIRPYIQMDIENSFNFL